LSTEIIAVPAYLQGSYFPSLDGLRGLAILMVILPHFGALHFLKGTGIFIDSIIGVHIFFVLSGFLITTLLLKEKLRTGKISLSHFYLRRILRIVPVVYLFLVVLIILNTCYGLHIPLIDFVASFLFFKNFPLRNEPYTAHLWTLAVEAQFYITFPLLLSYSVNKYFITALSIVIVVPVVAILGDYHTGFLFAGPAITFFTKLMMYAFWKGPVIILIGSVFAILTFKNIIKPISSKAGFFLGFILLVIAIVIHTKTFLFYSKYVSEYISAILIAWAIVMSANAKSLLSIVLQNRALVRIGIISYSLYVWQELFIGTNTWQPWMMALNGYPAYVIVLVKLAATFAIAFASYYLFESKFLKLKKKFG